MFVIFVFLVLNGTCAMSAYLLHMTGVRFGPIAITLVVGGLLGNLAVYAGVAFATKVLRKTDPGDSN